MNLMKNPLAIAVAVIAFGYAVGPASAGVNVNIQGAPHCSGGAPAYAPQAAAVPIPVPVPQTMVVQGPPTVYETPATTVEVPGQTVQLPPTQVTVPGQRVEVPGQQMTVQSVPQIQGVPECPCETGVAVAAVTPPCAAAVATGVDIYKKLGPVRSRWAAHRHGAALLAVPTATAVAVDTCPRVRVHLFGHRHPNDLGITSADINEVAANQ